MIYLAHRSKQKIDRYGYIPQARIYWLIDYNSSVGAAILKPGTDRMHLKYDVTSHELFVLPLYNDENGSQPNM